MQESLSVSNKVFSWINKYPELSFLTLDIESTPELTSALIGGYGQEFFPNKPATSLIEFNRTVMSLLALEYLFEGNYESFCKGQDSHLCLSIETFNTLCAWCQETLSSPPLLEAMRVFLAINDLGKIKKYIDMASVEKFHSADHDEILSFLLKEKEREIPSFAGLAENEKHILFAGAKTNFNMGQFLKAENLPIHLNVIKNQDKKILNFFLLHTFLDIAGAKGHINQTGPILASEALCQDFLNGLTAVEMVCQDKNAVKAYTHYLSFKAKIFGVKTCSRSIPLLRLAHILNVKDAQQYNAMQSIVDNLKITDKKIFLNFMSYDEDMGEAKGYPYIFIYYSPALYSNIFSNLKWQHLSQEHKFNQSTKLIIDIFVGIFKYYQNHYEAQNCLVMARSLAVLAQKDIEEVIKKAQNQDFDFELFSSTSALVSLKV